MSDTQGAIAVLVSFGAIALGWRWGDSLGAFVVAVLVGRTAWRVLSANLGVLADHAQLEPAQVRAIVLAVPEVRGAHHIRSRGSPDHVHVDLHIHVDPAMSVARAHEVTHAADIALRDQPLSTQRAGGRRSRPTRCGAA